MSNSRRSTPSWPPDQSLTLGQVWFNVRELTKAHLRAIVKSRGVRPTMLRSSLHSAHVVVVVTVKNESARLPRFLDYYREIGADHFIVIDNESDDGTDALLAPMTDVSRFSATGSFKRSRFGYDWVNFIVNRWCGGKWVLYADADEAFVWPHADGTDLRDLCANLDRSKIRSSQAILLDMYSDSAGLDNKVSVGQDPLDVCNLYDAAGYTFIYAKHSRTTWIKGGVRGRLFFPSNIEASPALNKTPLVRWRKGYAFLRATHVLAPATLNRQSPSATSALLHFKFTQAAISKVASMEYRDQHDREYASYPATFGAISCMGDYTSIYRSASDLVEAGLISDKFLHS